jgi:putative OPT family oligopeptide transporter
MGIMFVALLRRVMVDDAELPFPESLAAAEIHKSGQSGTGGSKFLFSAMGIGALIKALGEFKLFAVSWQKVVTFTRGGGLLLRSPGVSPAYLGVGYIIGPKLAGLNFSGGIIAWGLLAPVASFFINYNNPGAADIDWASEIVRVWGEYIRPVAIGGMLVGSAYTLWNMRKSLIEGISRSISDVKKAAQGESATQRIDQDISFPKVILGILVTAIATYFIYYYFANDVIAALVATVVMVVFGFLFAAVSGYLVGIIGSSNNPISGLTISVLVVAAILMVSLGMEGTSGVAAVLGVAAVVAVAAAVAGEMLQDLKAGHILGGTPWRMQVGDIIGVFLSAAVMFFVLMLLHEGDIATGIKQGYEGGFGSEQLAAPQASLMAILSEGIVTGQMQWILIAVGMLMGVGFILMNVKSPMLVSVGMYLPLGTTFAIFVGGIFKGIVNNITEKRKFNTAQNARVDNVGTLLAAGLIAGEALIGILFAALAYMDKDVPAIFARPSFLVSLVVFAFIGWILIRFSVKNAGDPDEPAPPAAAS